MVDLLAYLGTMLDNIRTAIEAHAEAIPGIIVSVLALLFTVASFWWIQVRRGRLLSWLPGRMRAPMHPSALADSSAGALQHRARTDCRDRLSLAFEVPKEDPTWTKLGAAG
jgi:hypothetical protein